MLFIDYFRGIYSIEKSPPPPPQNFTFSQIYVCSNFKEKNGWLSNSLTDGLFGWLGGLLN